MALPPNHAYRNELNDEVHARPSDALRAPLRVSYLALLSDGGARTREWTHLGSLLRELGAEVPPTPKNHFSARIGELGVRWERHAEFTRYTFTLAGEFADPFRESALSRLPGAWIAAIPGEIMVASHGAILPAADHEPNPDELAERYFDGNVLVGAQVGGGAGTAFADFRVRNDGFSRFLLFDHHLTPRQMGRTVQRILEIDTYRMMALLALPLARELGPFIGECERELAAVTTALARAEIEDEAQLLERLTRLEAQIESREAANQYRFGAAAAYYELVQRRIGELREVRLHGLQTFGEFTERRLAPAMNTCRTAANRQESMSQRVARVNELLSTRVDLTLERQNQALLESMNRRTKAQLRLQQTVEGLSVAAVTYYIVGLVGYVAKGLKAAGIGVNPELAQAIAIPVILAFAAAGIHHLRDNATRGTR